MSSTTHPHATDCQSASPSRPFPGTSGKTPQQHALILPCHTAADRDLPRQTCPFCCRNPPGRDPHRKDKKHARAVFIKAPDGLQPAPEVRHQPVKFFALIYDEHTRPFVGGGQRGAQRSTSATRPTKAGFGCKIFCEKPRFTGAMSACDGEHLRCRPARCGSQATRSGSATPLRARKTPSGIAFDVLCI